MKKKLTVGGLPPIEIIPDDKMAECDFAVCARIADQPEDPFARDLRHGPSVEGLCAHCLTPIRWRPYLPATLKKICVICAADLAGHHKA